MAQIPGTNIIAPVVPFDSSDVHPTHEALYGRGGWRTVATTAERDAIPMTRREEGMVVVVTADGKRWVLEADLTSWVEMATGGGGSSAWADITGKPTTVSGFGITDAVTTADSRLTDSREWIASTVSQAEAEAGTATTRRAWTAERVRQAIAAWWTALSVPIAKVAGLQAAIDAKAPIDSPQFTNFADAARFTDDVDTVTSISGGFLTTRRVTFEDDTAGVWQTTAFTGTLKTKLDGVATGATANATDAQLRDRSTHTGTQAAGTITGLAAVATSGSAADLTTGTLPAARLPGAPVYLQQTTPPGTGWVWFQTNGSGDVVDIITG